MINIIFFTFCILAYSNFVPPPGTELLCQNKFIDKQLITYGGYNEFLFQYKQNGREDLLKKLIPIDTSITYKKQQMWNNEKFIDFPIAGLEREQITAYCAWRSNVVNSWKNNPENRTCNFEYWNKFDKCDPQHEFKIVYRLPSQSDLEMYQAKKEKYWLNEMTEDGSFKRKKISKKISHKELMVFRCIAIYESVK